jgi:hypothetical protein
MMSVRITAAGAVAVSLLAFFTAPVSACDERFIKKCERASAAAVAAAETPTAAPAAKRKSSGRVHVAVSRRGKLRFAKRMHAPGFAIKRERMTLASAESSAATLVPDSPLARRFRGFIDPRPLAQNAFEALRKPHLVDMNLEPVAAVPPAEVAEMPAAEPVVAAPVPAVITTAKQDRIAPKTAPTMELASAESRPVTLPPVPPVKMTPALIATANAAVAPPVPQVFVSEAPPLPADPPVNRFSIHQLVLALCGALGAASALRFIVGA